MLSPRKLTPFVAALVGAGAALAQSPEPRTRAEVRAEAIAARQAGSIEYGDTAGLRTLMSLPSQRSRAEVHAEAVAANQARAGRVTYGDGPLLDDMLRSTTSTLSRAQVRAEAVEWRRLGLSGYGDRKQRAPTPAEMESVRQAGLRAIGMENMARN